MDNLYAYYICLLASTIGLRHDEINTLLSNGVRDKDAGLRQEVEGSNMAGVLSLTDVGRWKACVRESVRREGISCRTSIESKHKKMIK